MTEFIWTSLHHSIDTGDGLIPPHLTNKNYAKQVDETRAFLTNAKSYLADPGKDRNLIFESTKGLFDGTQTLFIHATNELQIVDAVNLAVESGIKKTVIVGGFEALLIC
jgi:hypothetical protein